MPVLYDCADSTFPAVWSEAGTPVMVLLVLVLVLVLVVLLAEAVPGATYLGGLVLP